MALNQLTKVNQSHIQITIKSIQNTNYLTLAVWFSCSLVSKPSLMNQLFSVSHKLHSLMLSSTYT